MDTFSLSVRLLSGETRVINVEATTPIQSLPEMLRVVIQDFRKFSIVVGAAAFSHGSLGEAGIMAGNQQASAIGNIEVQAILSTDMEAVESAIKNYLKQKSMRSQAEAAADLLGQGPIPCKMCSRMLNVVFNMQETLSHVPSFGIVHRDCFDDFFFHKLIPVLAKGCDSPLDLAKHIGMRMQSEAGSIIHEWLGCFITFEMVLHTPSLSHNIVLTDMIERALDSVERLMITDREIAGRAVWSTTTKLICELHDEVRCQKALGKIQILLEILQRWGLQASMETVTSTEKMLGELLDSTKNEEMSVEVMDDSTASNVSSISSTTDLESSEHEAMQLEQADLQEALMRSNADARNADGVVILRLTSHSSQIKQHLVSNDLLRAQVDFVQSAGCEACPKWGNGALLFIPATQEQMIEAQIQLQPHNIVLRERDEPLLKEALKQLPKRKRNNAELKPEYQANHTWEADETGFSSSCFESATSVHSAAPDASIYVALGIEIQNTFLHLPATNFELSETSSVVHSAPADGGHHPEPKNHRRWGKRC